MSKEVFITTVTSYFPNSPIDNNSMEDYLGLISGIIGKTKCERYKKRNAIIRV